MKIISFIFSLWFALLAFQPLLKDIYLSTTVECSLNCCGNPIEEPGCGDEEDNSCNGICNPVLTCGGCVGFIFSGISMLPSVMRNIMDLNTFYPSAFISEIAIPFWQPPKIK